MDVVGGLFLDTRLCEPNKELRLEIHNVPACTATDAKGDTSARIDHTQFPGRLHR